MRIALFSWETAHSIYIGGVASHVTELACALERKGHETHVFTRMGRHDHALYERIDGVHYHRCPFAHHPDFVEEMNNMCRSFVHTFFETEDHIGAFDIVHAHDWLTANAMSWIKEGRGRKAVFTLHSTEYGRSGNHFWGGNSERIRHIEWHGAYCADHVITVSNALKNEVQWIYSVPDGKMDVIYNGISYRNFDGWLDPGAVKKSYEIGTMDPVVLFAGRMAVQKGPDLLVEAIPHVLKYYHNAKFVFVGDGAMRQSVENTARHRGVSHATKFLGHLSGWKLVDLFKACDCVCIPSRNEPFGIVILEAWSAGKPVIASINGGPSEIVWHDVNGFKINANSDSIAWGIGTLFANFEHARWMGANGRVAAETVFSWDTIADEVLTVYQS
ncbi:MAG TPA: glycosyltransferase family 1 protein [Candidatus Omnitrophica bacterium]|nr:MAG: glycosyl transferase [Omnitrophica WOR_2 bacterium GWA2_45_18]OGX19416.1 MAG: glycosyl transferase [Omnitrophica WOR_2 bacterium GWC2_45_7]HBR14132.1 glycosyltransferase family 1 protein [Candidatus Omnitrophota bacterium]